MLLIEKLANKILTLPALCVIVFSVPDAAGSLSVLGTTPTSISLSWNSSSNGVVNATYINCVDLTNSSVSPLSMNTSVTKSAAATYNITGLLAGHTYSVCIVLQSYNRNSSASCTNVTTSE